MLIYNILLNEKSNLNFLGKSDENIELISTQITEFKKHGVSLENLDEMIESSKDKYLKSKMNDMKIVFSKFEETIQNKYIDENDVLTILANQLLETNIFENTLIYIDEFVGFTKQEYDIIKILLNMASQVTINVCTDSLEESNSPDTDIFYANKQTVQKIKDVAKIEIYGIQTPTIDVSVSPSVMAQSGITTSDIARAFEAQNKVVDAGGIDAGQNRLRIESTGNFYSLDDIRNLTIVSRSGEHFRLADIAQIEESYQTPASNLMRIDGNPAIGIAISTVPTGNVVDMAEAVKKRIDELSQSMPEGYELTSIYVKDMNQPLPIKALS